MALVLFQFNGGGNIFSSAVEKFLSASLETIEMCNICHCPTMNFNSLPITPLGVTAFLILLHQSNVTLGTVSLFPRLSSKCFLGLLNTI